jgi:hypothetical protein
MAICSKCGIETEWQSKSGYCRKCADEVLRGQGIIRKWWFWLIVIVLAGVILRGVTSAPETVGYFNADGSLKTETASDFSFIAQKAVKEYLKAPSTAEFEGIHDTWYSFDNDVYALSGTFTAQNALGVPLESEFFVKFWYGGDLDSYEVRIVAVDDETFYNIEE